MRWDRGLESRIRSRYGVVRPAAPMTVDPEPETAFVVEGQDGHTYVSTPAQVSAEVETAAERRHYLSLSGRLVEAERPNANGAMWTSEDLQMAQTTVAHGPLNWLHEEHHIIGTLTQARFVPAAAPALRLAASEDVGPHIAVDAKVWRFLYPREASILQSASDGSSLWLSMECVSRTVTCMDTPDRPGCGETFDYLEAVRRTDAVCSHLKERSSVRRFNEPTFLGAAVIVPPTRPGWANADARVVEAAETLPESMQSEAAKDMVAQILRYARIG